MGKKSGFGFGMNNPDHISEILETIFWVKLLKFFDQCGSGMEKIRIRDKHPGPQHRKKPPFSKKTGVLRALDGICTVPTL
jgi:hypothetical protein